MRSYHESLLAAMPDRIILVRHGESEGNADHTLCVCMALRVVWAWVIGLYVRVLACVVDMGRYVLGVKKV